MQTEGVSVIITAYHTENYIEECLDSVVKQTWFKDHNDWEILLGIDHCENTLKKVKDIMPKYDNLRVFYNKENVGTYITSNTLISKAKYARILRFDSDDIMKDNMIEKMMLSMSSEKNCKVVQCYFENYPKKENSTNTGIAHGVLLCKKSVFTEYGGFKPWKCAADTEFLTRIKRDIKPVVYHNVLFYYRMHDASLTKDKKTNMQSDIRKEYRKYIDIESSKHPVIETVISETSEILLDATKNSIEPSVNTTIVNQPLDNITHVKKTVRNAVRKRVVTVPYIGI